MAPSLLVNADLPVRLTKYRLPRGNTLVKNAANERSSGLGPSSLLTGVPNSFLIWARVNQHWHLHLFGVMRRGE